MLTLIEASSALPISLRKIKTHLRIDHTAENHNLKLLINAAATCVEQTIGRSLLVKLWRQTTVAELAENGLARVPLPNPPLTRVLSVHELGPKGVNRPVLRFIVEWEKLIPTILLMAPASRVEVVYEAGYGTLPSDIPAPIRQAILMLAAEMYETRTSAGSLPDNAVIQALLAPYKIATLA